MRQKNALTQYYVGEAGTASVPGTATLRLAHRITEVNDSTDETTEDYADYAGDGTLVTDVTGVRKGYDFVGQFDSEDVAMSFIAALEFETGDMRKITFKQVRTDGKTYTGPAIVSSIVATGGAAEDYAPFQCTIAWTEKPTLEIPEP